MKRYGAVYISWSYRLSVYFTRVCNLHHKVSENRDTSRLTGQLNQTGRERSASPTAQLTIMAVDYWYFRFGGILLTTDPVSLHILRQNINAQRTRQRRGRGGGVTCNRCWRLKERRKREKHYLKYEEGRGVSGGRGEGGVTISMIDKRFSLKPLNKELFCFEQGTANTPRPAL